VADILALRTDVRAADAQLAAAQQQLDTLLEQINDFEIPANIRKNLVGRIASQRQVVGRLTNRRGATQAAYHDAVMADPMYTITTGVPLVLFPVRIETAYLSTAAGGFDLAVRIYPDDIHVDAHETELTARELDAGTTYWNAVWGAGSNTARLDTAWNELLAKLRPSRAAWVRNVLTPAEPRPADETPLDQAQPVPPLPAVATKPSTFTRAAHTTLLPDRWNVIGLRDGKELFNVEGASIPDTLPVSFGPPERGAVSSDLPFDEASRWLVDVDAAMAVGMAVRIPLAGPDFTIDQLFVIGTGSHVEMGEAANRVQSALQAHEYTNGLGFLPPGAPTNNTDGERSAWQAAPQPPTPAEVDSARARYLVGSLQNAALTAKALGIDGQITLSVAAHGLDDQQTAVMKLQERLWPALGAKALSMLYNLWEIPPNSPPGGWHLHNNIELSAFLAQHIIGWVRSRGTLPTLRVGNQPYGLLPVSSLTGWVSPPDDLSGQLADWLRLLRPYWLAGVGSTPRVVVGGDDPDAAVVNVLSRLPVSARVMVRPDGDPISQVVSNRPLPVGLIPSLPTNSELFLSAPSDAATSLPTHFVADAAADRDLLLQFKQLYADSIAVLEGPMIATDWINKYRSLIGTSSFAQMPPADIFNALFHDALGADPLGETSNFTSTYGITLCLALFSSQKSGEADFQAQVKDFLPKAHADFAQFEDVCTLDPSEYEAATREILDVFSHRYDAWVTSLAARRLDQLRAVTPSGIAFGGYGWLEELAPSTDLKAVEPPPPGFDTALGNPHQRYIHAPSLHHAATAAVLRAGFDSHPNPDALAVNLESARIRTAEWLAAGVRNGQPLGALLGYRLERNLHEAGLDALIADFFRKHYPLQLLTSPDGDVNGKVSSEAIQARNVADGLKVYRDRDAIPSHFENDDQIKVKIVAILNDLVIAVDSLGDLLLAESVHHLVGGNPLRAGHAADAIGRGEAVPDRFAVVQTPRSGRPLTWQLGAILPAVGAVVPVGWQSNRPRAMLSPQVEAWAATMLGEASRWTVTCSVTTSDGATTPVPITLDTLGLSALDVVVEAAGDPSPLERRIIDSLEGGMPTASVLAVVRTPTTDGSLGFGELLAMAARIRFLLGTAAPLGPLHLEGPGASPVLGMDVDELATRVEALRTSFIAAVTQLQNVTATLEGASPASQVVVDAVRSALVNLADHGVSIANPTASRRADPDTALSLSEQARAVLATIESQAALPQPVTPAANSSASDQERWLVTVTDYVQTVVGRGVPIIPLFSLPLSSSFAASFAEGAAPVGADGPAVMTWLRRVGRVRPKAGAVHDLLLARAALDIPGLLLATGQLPVEPGAQWVGLPFKGAMPSTARVATVLATQAPIDPAAKFGGLVFDTWTETLPGLTTVADRATGVEPAEVTGVAFTVNAPDAYPPQAILLAVPPDLSQPWSLDVLFDIVQETLELAQMRSVDLGDLPRLGRVLPAIHSGSQMDALIQNAGVKS